MSLPGSESRQRVHQCAADAAGYLSKIRFVNVSRHGSDSDSETDRNSSRGASNTPPEDRIFESSQPAQVTAKKFEPILFYEPRSTSPPATIIHQDAFHGTMCTTTSQSVPQPQSLVIAVDGACRQNGTSAARASFGIYFGFSSLLNTYNVLEHHDRQTNNSAEFEAAIQALNLVQSGPLLYNWRLESGDNKEVIIMTDSQYVVKCICDWIHEWRRNGFINSKGDPVANVSKIKRLDSLISTLSLAKIKVKFWLVRREYVKEADGLANHALDQYGKGITNLGPARPQNLPNDPIAWTLARRIGLDIVYALTTGDALYIMLCLILAKENLPEISPILFGCEIWTCTLLRKLYELARMLVFFGFRKHKARKLVAQQVPPARIFARSLSKYESDIFDWRKNTVYRDQGTVEAISKAVDLIENFFSAST